MEEQYNNGDNFTGWCLEGFSDKDEVLRRLTMIPLPFRIGRQPDLSLCLSSREVSRIHAEIFQMQSSLGIRDLGSTNGTFVNYQRLQEPVRLYDGDIIHFGRREFRIVHELMDPVGFDEMTDIYPGDLPQKMPSGARSLQKMIHEKTVTTYFQPLVDLLDGQIFGYEILGRGDLPGFERSPMKLFQIASTINMSAELSDLFRQTGVSIGSTLPGYPILFINTHPAEMGDWNRLVRNFQRLRSGFPSLQFTVEIHEGAVTDLNRMRSLRSLFNELDIKLAYDDFGSGQARLLELAEVPPDYLKVDRSLIRNIHQASPRRQRMIEVLVHFLNETGVKTLAEGVSCVEEDQICRQLNFDCAQGYYYGKPAPRENF
jgi:EAL domain-containing protein (putative c-di-GMP-specific phosphodiesterase class I)